MQPWAGGDQDLLSTSGRRSSRNWRRGRELCPYEDGFSVGWEIDIQQEHLQLCRPQAYTGPLQRVENCLHAKGELASEHGVEQREIVECAEGMWWEETTHTSTCCELPLTESEASHFASLDKRLSSSPTNVSC